MPCFTAAGQLAGLLLTYCTPPPPASGHDSCWPTSWPWCGRAPTWPVHSEKMVRTQYLGGQERHLFMDLIQERQAVVFSKVTNARVISQKTKAWEEISAALSAAGGPTRTPKQVRKIWENLKGRAKKIDSDRKQEGHKTGGGAPDSDTKLDPLIEKVLALIAHELEPPPDVCDSDAPAAEQHVRTATQEVMESVEYIEDVKDDFEVDVKDEPIDCLVSSSHLLSSSGVDKLSSADTAGHQLLSPAEDPLKVEEPLPSQPRATPPVSSQHTARPQPHLSKSRTERFEESMVPRTSPISEIERSLFIQLLREERVLHNTKTDGKMVLLKRQAWTRITQKFNSYNLGPKRTEYQLRKVRERLKLKEKKKKAASGQEPMAAGDDSPSTGAAKEPYLIGLATEDVGCQNDSDAMPSEASTCSTSNAEVISLEVQEGEPFDIPNGLTADAAEMPAAVHIPSSASRKTKRARDRRSLFDDTDGADGDRTFAREREERLRRMMERREYMLELQIQEAEIRLQEARLLKEIRIEEAKYLKAIRIEEAKILREVAQKRLVKLNKLN